VGWWKAPWQKDGPAVMSEEVDEAALAEQAAEAKSRELAFQRALARGLAAQADQTGPPMDYLKVVDPLNEPAPDGSRPITSGMRDGDRRAFITDSRLWERLMVEAAVSDLQCTPPVDPAAGLYWALYCVRSNGAELEPYAPKGWAQGEPLEWRIIPGPDYTGGKVGYEEDKQAWLMPFAERLIPLLRRMKLYARREKGNTDGTKEVQADPAAP
jgi:hypothetical protein